MAFMINAQQRRRYTRAALWSTVTSDVLGGVVFLVVGLAGSSYLVRTLGFPPTVVHVAVAVLLLQSLVSTTRDLYLLSKLRSEIAGSGLELDMLGSTEPGSTPANPTAILDFERRMIGMARPFAWARAVVDVILAVMIMALIVIAWRHVGLLDASTRVLYIIGVLLMLAVIGGTVSDVYRTWAMYWVPLAQKWNVVVKPVELLLLVIWLSFLAVFDSIFVLSGEPQQMAMALLPGAVGAWILISNYRQTVSRAIVNPIDVAPITIDAGEKIAISVAGLTMVGTGILNKVGFGRRLPQQSVLSPASGRMLNSWAQNAFLVSETRVYFIFVPIGLGDQAPEQMSMIESLLGGSHGRAKLDEMLRTMTLRQIYESDPINFAINLSDVGRVEITRTKIRQVIAFVDRNGDKIRAFIEPSPQLEEFEAFAQRTGIVLSVVDP